MPGTSPGQARDKKVYPSHVSTAGPAATREGSLMKTKIVSLLIFALFATFPIAVISETNLLTVYSSRITEYTLKNGIHFILLEDHTSPVVSFHVHAKVGSVDESKGETGISHLIEHLAFNGTPNIGTVDWKKEKEILRQADMAYEQFKQAEKTGKDENMINSLRKEFHSLNGKAASLSRQNEFGKILDMHGAVGPNAYTSYDMTAYWVELPSNKTELWASLESDRLFNPVFRGFYEELEVVKEERRMRVDNSPWGRLMEEFSGVAYRIHPYRNPVIGYREDIENMTRSGIRDFYTRHYVPSNIIVTVAGDIYPDKFLQLAEKYFGNIPPGKNPAGTTGKEPADSFEKRVIVRLDSQPILLIGYKIQNISHPDIPALEICSEILAGGRTSRLYRKLVKEERTAVSTGAWCWAPRYPGLFYLWAVASEAADNGRIEKSIFDEIEKLKEGGIKAEEISGARARLRMEFLSSLKSRLGMAREIAWYKAVTGDWRNLFRYAENLENVTEEDIVEVVKKYFKEDNRTVGMVEPRPKDSR